MAKREILVVEDDATLRRILRDVLTIKGYEVFVAEDGEEGVAAFAEHNIGSALNNGIFLAVNHIDGGHHFSL